MQPKIITCIKYIVEADFHIAPFSFSCNPCTTDMSPFNSLVYPKKPRDNSRRMISGALWKSYFAFYLREVWNHIGSEVTKRDDRAFPSPIFAGSSRTLSILSRERKRKTGRERDVVPILVYPGAQDAGILVECLALNPGRRFRRGPAHVPPHGNYEIRDTGHVLLVPWHAGSPSSSWSPGCPRARRLAKVRMMYHDATIIAFLSLPLSFSQRLPLPIIPHHF